MHSLTKVLYIQRSLPCDMLSSVILKRTGSVKSKNFCFGHFPCVLLLEEIERFSLFMTTVPFVFYHEKFCFCFFTCQDKISIWHCFCFIFHSHQNTLCRRYVDRHSRNLERWAKGLAPTTFSMKPTKHQKASTSSSIRNNIGERRSLMPCT